MAPKSHQTLKAKGSHATRGGWEPTRCGYGQHCLYGGRLLITGPHSLWFEKDDRTGNTIGFHVDCWRNIGVRPPS